MKVTLALLALVVCAAGAALAGVPRVAGTQVAWAKPCGAGYTHAVLSWGHKCLRAGQFCKVSRDREYHRSRFHCHTGGRLSRAAGGQNGGSGCQSGYSPCLPRVSDLNCSDIPAAKRPVRVTGSDPYRLDGDGDGIACEG